MFMCVHVLERAMLSTCISFLLSAITIRVVCDTSRTRRSVEVEVGVRGVTGRGKRNGDIVKWLQFKTPRPGAGW